MQRGCTSQVGCLKSRVSNAPRFWDRIVNGPSESPPSSLRSTIITSSHNKARPSSRSLFRLNYTQQGPAHRSCGHEPTTACQLAAAFCISRQLPFLFDTVDTFSSPIRFQLSHNYTSARPRLARAWKSILKLAPIFTLRWRNPLCRSLSCVNILPAYLCSTVHTSLPPPRLGRYSPNLHLNRPNRITTRIRLNHRLNLPRCSANQLPPAHRGGGQEESARVGAGTAGTECDQRKGALVRVRGTTAEVALANRFAVRLSHRQSGAHGHCVPVGQPKCFWSRVVAVRHAVIIAN